MGISAAVALSGVVRSFGVAKATPIRRALPTCLHFGSAFRPAVARAATAKTSYV